MNFPNLELLLFLIVLAFPKASNRGLAVVYKCEFYIKQSFERGDILLANSMLVYKKFY